MISGKFIKFLKQHPIEVILFLITCTFLIGSSFIIKPRIKGDGAEYFLMLESFSNHFSANLLNEDINHFQYLIERDKDKHMIIWDKNIAYTGYYEDKDNKNYSYHFWLYSFMTMPLKKILSIVDHELYSFQVFNAILLSISIFGILFLSEIKTFYKVVFFFNFVINPILWFIFWPHPELFSACFVIISLIGLKRKSTIMTLIPAAIASTQNQPIIILFFFLFIYILLDKQFNKKK